MGRRPFAWSFLVGGKSWEMESHCATGLTLDVLIGAGSIAEIVDCESNARSSA